MTQWWGSRLVDSYGAECPPDWAFLIDRTEDERLTRAMQTLRRETPVHPPTLGQFEAAIPLKAAAQRKELSVPEILTMEAVKRWQLCPHQLLARWNHFGPIREFPPLPPLRKHPISHPDPIGVVIPACDKCGQPSHRLRIEDVEARQQSLPQQPTGEPHAQTQQAALPDR